MLDLKTDELAEGVLGLVVALVEIVKDALVHAATGRVESGHLSDDEVDALGDALAELEEAVASLKADDRVGRAATSVREGLNRLVEDLTDRLAHPTTASLTAPHADR